MKKERKLKRWNKADSTLCTAFLFFLVVLMLHILFPYSLVWKAILFCAEAALVGGIADWFAVTALFREPLGFPYHTALLPRRRKSFIQASVTMVQKEFFSRKKLFHHLENIHLLPMLFHYLEAPETKERVISVVLHYMKNMLMQQNMQPVVNQAANILEQKSRALPPEFLWNRVDDYLKKSGKDAELLGRLSKFLAPRISSAQMEENIEKFLSSYERKNASEGWSSLLADLAKGFNLVNYEEAAGILQQQMIAMNAQLQDPRSETTKQFLENLHAQATAMTQDPVFCQRLSEWKENVLAEVPFSDLVNRFFHDVVLDWDGAEDAKEMGMNFQKQSLSSAFQNILQKEYDQLLEILQSDEKLQKIISDFLYDLIARTALHAQSLIGIIVERVLSHLSDEQLNEIVYSKVEPDLVWIRMNGSIVGAGVGLILFCGMYFLGFAV